MDKGRRGGGVGSANLDNIQIYNIIIKPANVDKGGG